MTKHAPLFAAEGTAAALLDMKLSEFRRLVDSGALPPPNQFARWDVAQLQSIMRGDAARPKPDGLEL